MLRKIVDHPGQIIWKLSYEEYAPFLIAQSVSLVSFQKKRTHELWDASLKVWFYMNCLQRALTIITFPWEHSCLAWTKFTGSKICNSSFHATNQRPISLHKQWKFFYSWHKHWWNTAGHVFKTITQESIKLRQKNHIDRRVWLDQFWSWITQTWFEHSHKVLRFQEPKY